MKNLIGAIIQQYQILAKIRETGTRILYKAYDPQTHQNVGLEVVKLHIMDNAALFELLNEQAKKNSSLTHPNIALVIDIGIHDDFIYLVYNFSPAHPLRRFFNRTYAWHEMSRELVSATQALAHAHEKGIIHGSLTPSCIVLNEKRIPFLFDFGFELIIANYILAHAPGSWINKYGVEYRAPERLLGDQPDWRSDIYSMGIILYEWLSGEIAFYDATILETLQKRLSSSPQDLKPEKENSPAVLTLIEKCLAADPNDRYQSMQEVGLILARGALDLTITRKMARKPLAPPSPTIKPGRILITIGLILITVIAGLFLTRAISLSGILNDHPTATMPTPTPTKPKTATPTKDIFTSTLIPTSPTQKVIPREGSGSSKFPLFEGTPISQSGETINISNSGRVIPISIWGMGDMNYLAVSPDGKYVAAASSTGLFIFNAKDLSFNKYVDTRSRVTDVEFSPDSKTIAVGDEDGLIQLWSTDTWAVLGEPFSRHTLGILDLDFSPDGSKLASVALDNTLIQWDIKSGGQIQIQVPVASVNSVAYSSDGKEIITGGGDFKVNVFNGNTLIVEKTFTHSSSKVVDVAILKNSPLVLIGDANRKLWLWNTKIIDNGAKKEEQISGNTQYPLSQITVSPDESMIAAGDVNGGIVVWSNNGEGSWIEKWRAQNYVFGNIVGTSGKVNSLTFSADGKLLYSGIRNGKVQAFDANTGSQVAINESLDAHTEKLEISHDGTYALIQYHDNQLKVWDLWNGKPLYQLQGNIIEGGAFSPNDDYFAVASNSSTVRLYESSSGREAFTFNGNGEIKTIQFILGGSYLVAGNKDGAHLWSLISGQELKTRGNVAGGCWKIQDLKGADIFYITDYHHVVTNSDNQNDLCNFPKSSLMKAFYISESNNRIAYGGESLLKVISTFGSPQEWNMYQGVKNPPNVTAVVINDEGSLLAAAYSDYTIHLWDIANHKELTTFPGLDIHTNTITDLQFTPNGSLLISTSSDGTIILWGVPY